MLTKEIKRKEDKRVNLSEQQKKEFDHVFREYQTMVYKLSLKYSDANENFADDATQYTFMQLYEEMKKGTEIQNIQTFLHTIVKNYTINCMKQKKHMNWQNELNNGETLKKMQVVDAETAYISQLDEIYTEQMARIILEELKVKNEVWYVIVMEVFYKGRSQLEVAEELDMNITAMYATVRRIREWAIKNRINFEENAKNATKEMSMRHLFFR